MKGDFYFVFFTLTYDLHKYLNKEANEIQSR